MRIINSMFMMVLFLCSSCSKTDYEKKRDLENQIIGKTWRQLEKEKNLIPVGEGKSITPGNEFIGLYFQYFHPLTIDQARELVVYASETFLHNLNSNEKLNELLESPYPMSRIKIDIYIYNPDYSNIEPPKISVVSFQNDEITYLYKRKKLEIERKNFEKIHKESYEEALKKVNKTFLKNRKILNQI